MKVCTKCQKEKDESEFRWRNKSKGLKSPWCKLCFSDYEKSKWASSEERRSSSVESNKLRRQRNSQFVFDLLKKSHCYDCSENDPIVLEFDHVRGKEKRGNISDMCKSSLSLEVIQEEISKCDIVCANCHRRRTAKQFNYYSYME